MNQFRYSSQRTARVATVTLALFLHACTRWTPAPVEPAQAPAAGPVRATLHTGHQVIIRLPVISGDTLREAAEGVRGPRTAIPLEQIARLEVSVTDAGATAGLVIVGGLVLGAIIVLVVLHTLQATWE